MLPGGSVDAVAFDFNGTLSDDEALLSDLFIEIAKEQLGLVVSRDWYFDALVGLSDREIVERLIIRADRSHHDPAVHDALLATKVERYCQEIAETPRITDDAVALVHRVAEVVPVALVTGAIRQEVDLALAGVGLENVFRAIVCADDVVRGKPDSQGYELALGILGIGDPGHVVAFEDSLAGLQAASSLGMWTVRVGESQAGVSEGLYHHSVCSLSLEEAQWLVDRIEADHGRNGR